MKVQSTLLNSLLHYYLDKNLVEQAEKLIAKSTLPVNTENNQLARYLYYVGLISLITGRVNAIQLNYSASHQNLLQAIRKAPDNPSSAGFQQAAYKFSVTVQLLMGEIPERELFTQPILGSVLKPYLAITQGWFNLTKRFEMVT